MSAIPFHSPPPTPTRRKVLRKKRRVRSRYEGQAGAVSASAASAAAQDTFWSGDTSMPPCTRSSPVGIPRTASARRPNTSLSSRLRSVSDLRQTGQITPQQKNMLKDMILEEDEDSVDDIAARTNAAAAPSSQGRRQLASALEAYQSKGDAKPIRDLLSSDDFAANAARSSGELSDNVMRSTSRLMARMSPSSSVDGSLSDLMKMSSQSSEILKQSQSNLHPFSSAESSNNVSSSSSSSSPFIFQAMASSSSSSSQSSSSSSISSSSSKNNSSVAIRPFANSLMGPPSGMVYDERMCVHRHVPTAADAAAAAAANKPLDRHPECPERIKAIYHALRSAGLAQHFERVQARLASDDEIMRVHTAKHCAEVKRLANDTSYRQLRMADLLEDSVYACAGTALAARLSAGSVIELTERVVQGKNRNGLAIVRPPGHHAERQRPMGFCLFNNCAVAAAHAQKHLGVKRILIVDWDVHHGNGIQKMFESDPGVFYFSVHRYHNGKFYPHTTDAGPHKIGAGDGTGYNANIGWNATKMGDGDYLAAWQRVLMPIAYEYAPQLVIVAAGFDAAQGDPLGQCMISPVGYAHLLHQLMGLAGGKVVVALEGGYSLETLSKSASACARTLLGVPPPTLAGGTAILPKASAMRAIKKTVEALQPYWRSLQTDPTQFKERPMSRALRALGNGNRRGERSGGDSQSRSSSPAPPSPRVARRMPKLGDLEALTGRRIKIRQQTVAEAAGAGGGSRQSIHSSESSRGDGSSDEDWEEEVWQRATVLGTQRGSSTNARIKFDSGKRSVFVLDEETYGEEWFMYARRSD